MASRVKSRTADQNTFHSLAVAVVHALTPPTGVPGTNFRPVWWRTHAGALMTNRKTKPRKIDEQITLIVTALAVIPTESCSSPQVGPRGLSSLSLATWQRQRRPATYQDTRGRRSARNKATIPMRRHCRGEFDPVRRGFPQARGRFHH